MNDQIRIALRNYIDALHRSADTCEAFADHLVALNRVVDARLKSPTSVQPLLEQARLHRVEALKRRGRIIELIQQSD